MGVIQLFNVKCRHWMFTGLVYTRQINMHLTFQLCSFAGQFLCSYSTLPLYALVTQVG